MATFKSTALGALLSAFLAACGGGSGSVDPDIDEAPVLQQPQSLTCKSTGKVVKIQLFGDSTQWGMDGSNPGHRAAVYPELVLQQFMDVQFGSGAVQVTTRAVSGTLAVNLLDGTDGLNLPWPQSVDADIAVVNFGINDKFSNRTAAQYQDDLHRLSVAPAKVVFETPLPVWSTAGISTSFAPEMLAVSQQIDAPSANTSAFVLSIQNWRKVYVDDGLHPDGAGYQLIVSNVLAPSLTPLVSKLRCQ